jgi:hypothetical protein
MGLNRETPARDAGYQMVQYIRASVTFADNGAAVSVGVIPAGALILKPISGAQVEEAFNAGTTNTIDIGTSADADLYATDLAGGTVTFVPIDEAVALTVSADTEIFATVGLTGTAATAGKATIVVAYIV